MKDYFEIIFWKIARHLIKKGYGCNCKTSDLDDFHEMYSKAPLSKSVSHGGRCGSCRAKEVCDWIDDEIELLRM